MVSKLRPDYKQDTQPAEWLKMRAQLGSNVR